MLSHSAPPSSSFIQEAAHLLQQIDEELPTLRQNFTVQKAHTLMRLAHTLKGAAATVGLEAIRTTTQALENTFKALCLPDATLTSAVEGLIFEGYDYLKLLLSAQLHQATINESDILGRVTAIVRRLQENLGERFGQDSYLPTSAQLGVDVTQSIFEGGVSEYLEELEQALRGANPEVLTNVLQIQAEVFMGLAESLGLPGFGAIAQAALSALGRHPEQVVTIARLALADYSAGQTAVLQGDRTRGGAPSEALKHLGARRPSRIRNWWQWINRWSAVESAPAPLAPSPQPLNTVFKRCHQAVDGLTQQLDKPVHIKIKGGDSLVDQGLIDRLSAPLMQLVCYIFEQDLEQPGVRRQLHKAAVGTLQLAAKQTDSHLVICVWADGGGVNPKTIYQRVYPQIKAIPGTLTVAHRPHKGTCFTLRFSADRA